MTVQSAFKRYLRIGREAVAWGTAAAGSLEYNATGNWFSAITTSPLGALKYIEPKIRTKGATGHRSTDQHPPVSGAQHSEGTLDFPFVSSYGGLMLATALGADSASNTADASVLGSTALGTSPQTINSGFTPPTTNRYPFFAIAFTQVAPAAFGATGNIVVNGTDVNDQAMTETVTFGATASLSFTVYTQQSFKTITSIVITGWVAGGGSGAVTIDGIQYVTHTITCADTSSSMSIEEFDDPGADTGKSWVYTGMTISQLALAFSTLEDEGLLMISPQMAGKFPTATAQSTYRTPPLLPWPSWTASVTKAGSAYARIQNANIVITPGSRLLRSATGSAQPAGKVDIARNVAITGQLYLEDATEYTAWKTGLVGAYVFTFTSPFKVTSAINQSLALTFTQLYWTLMDPKEDDGLVVADFSAYVREDTTNNVISASLVNTKAVAY